jgi:hypothetical protein
MSTNGLQTGRASMTAIAFMIWLRDESGIALFETNGSMKRPSNGELRRWIRDRAVWVCGEPLVDANEEIGFPVTSLVLFPKGKRRVTIL